MEREGRSEDGGGGVNGKTKERVDVSVLCIAILPRPPACAPYHAEDGVEIGRGTNAEGGWVVCVSLRTRGFQAAVL